MSSLSKHCAVNMTGFIKRMELYSILQYRKYLSYQSSNCTLSCYPSKLLPKSKGLSLLMSVKIYNLNITIICLINILLYYCSHVTSNTHIFSFNLDTILFERENKY